MEETMLTIFQDYFSDTTFGTLFVVALIFCLVYKQKHQKVLSLGLLLITLLVYNDTSRELIKKLGESDTYYRFIWILPVTLVIAFAFTIGLDGVESNWYKAILIIGLILIVNLRSTETTFSREEDSYDIPKDVVQICEIINNDYDATGKTPEEIMVDKRVAAPAEMELQIRTYDPSFSYSIGRWGYMHIMKNGLYSDSKKYRDAIFVAQAVGYGVQGDPYVVRESIDKLDIKYLVVYIPHYMESYLALVDCNIIGYSDNYAVYRVN